jgi:hypothetical protein
LFEIIFLIKLVVPSARFECATLPLGGGCSIPG